MKRLGIKGFDENLKCRGLQYEIGKTYYDDKKPMLCRNGFHYSRTINDVKKFYGGKKTRYCVIEAIGDVDEGEEKSCTNAIKIVREVTHDNIKNNAPLELLEALSEDGFVIGGSTALRLYGYNIRRENKEVDLIIPHNSDLKDNNRFKYMKEINRFSGIDSVKCYCGLFGEKYDIITQSDIQWVYKTAQGFKIKVQDEDTIWNKKLEYALNGSLKHIGDIRDNGIIFKKEITPHRTIHRKITDEIPF